MSLGTRSSQSLMEARMAVQRWTSRRRAAFLKALADTGNVSAAARAAKASR